MKSIGSTLKRRRSCKDHVWSPMELIGFRRDLCTVCGAISITPTDTEMRELPLHFEAEMELAGSRP
jgi:hypothetical protein